MKNKLSRFNREADAIVIERMRKYENHRKPYSMISKEIDKSPKQIRQRWKNNLNPSLCHDSLDGNEKSFIVQRVESNKANKTPDGTISWKDLSGEIKRNFGRLHSENKIKNFWYSRQRQRRKGGNKVITSPSKYEYEGISSMDILCKAAEYMYICDFKLR